jgi:DNA primase
MDEVAEIKSRLDIVEVVGGYIPLKQAGRNLKAPCPFHDEKTASFMVSPEKGIYHCFGCGEGGDVFSFVEKMEGLDFRGALELLARRAGVELKAKRGENQEAAKLKSRLLEAHALAAQYYQATLVKNPKALDYVVKERNLNRQTIRDFQIGYAPDSWTALTDYLTKKGFRQDELIKGGLAGKKDGRSNLYDHFRGRIIFTICDRDGRPIGFTARVLGDDLPKYLNTPQTPLYDKSNAIYGLHLAKEAIRKANEVVLVEGNMDVLASHQAGIKQVVAASGTALTLDQLRTLSKLTKNIKLAFDSDRAGLVATERAIELGQKLGLTLRMVATGEAKDADELIQQDPKLWAKAIAEAKYIVDYLIERFETDYDLTTAVGKRQYADRLATNLRRLADPVERDHYVQQLAKKLGISEEAIRAKLEQPADSIVGTPPLEPRPTPAKLKPRQRGSRTELEESLLAMTLAYPITRLALDDLSVLAFSSPERQLIFQALREHAKETGVGIAKLLTSEANYVNILVLRGEEEVTSIAPADRSLVAFGLARRLLITANKDRKEDLTNRLRDAEKDGDVRLVSRLLNEYQALLTQEE